MSVVLAQRALLLAGATLLAVMVALAIAEQRGGARSARDLTASVPAPGRGWYQARAGLE